jgi:hypothetical protein
MGAASWTERQRMGGGAVLVLVAATTAWRRGRPFKRRTNGVHTASTLGWV